MAKEVLQRREVLESVLYHTKEDTFARLFAYDREGNLNRSVLRRRTGTGFEEVPGAYLSEIESIGYAQKIREKRLTKTDFEKLSDIHRQEPSEGRGYMFIWEKLPNGKYKFKARRVISPPERRYKTEVKAAKTDKAASSTPSDTNELGLSPLKK